QPLRPGRSRYLARARHGRDRGRAGSRGVRAGGGARGVFQGMLFGTRRLADPARLDGLDPAFFHNVLPQVPRVEPRLHRGEWLLVHWYAHSDGEAVRAPTLLIVGDRDIVRVEHAVQMQHLISDARLAVFPATDHLAAPARPRPGTSRPRPSTWKYAVRHPSSLASPTAESEMTSVLPGSRSTQTSCPGSRP